MITTVLADNDPNVRRNLRALLRSERGCTVVAEAADGFMALQLIFDLKPVLAVLDVQLPGLNGLEVAERLQSEAPDTRVIMLSNVADEVLVLKALRYGVSGYMLKDDATTDVQRAVTAAVAGKRFLSAALAERAIDAYAQRANPAEPPLDRYELLTERERDVLQLAAEGLGHAEIGDRLSISSRAAETHRANFLRKLRLGSQADVVRFAIQRGLIAG